MGHTPVLNKKNKYKPNKKQKQHEKIGTLLIFGKIAVVLGFYILASENYSNGERIGTITKFSSTGRFLKTHEIV